MPVIVAALSWSWRETEVDPLTGALRANRRDRGPSGAELAALEHALRLAERWSAPVVAASELLDYLRRWGYVAAGHELAGGPARTEPK